MKKHSNMILTLILLFYAIPVMAAVIEVSQPSYCTDNSQYDRNPSIISDGADYWLFYTKGDNISTDGVRGPGYDPDSDSYVVYYKTASIMEGLAAAAETKLVLSETGRPANFDQRVVSAAYFDGSIYAFVSSGQSGIDRGLYYYRYSGGSWSGPFTLIADATARGGHVNVVANGTYVYIVWESADGSSDCYSWNGSVLSSKIDISNGNQPKITFFDQAKSGNLFVVNIEDGTGDIEVYLAVASPNPLFSHHSTAIAGGGYYDPCIFTDNIDLYVISAPWVSGDDRQYLIQAKFDMAASVWSSAMPVSYGGYDDVYWWEYWPCGYHDGVDSYIFFTTETNSPEYSDGEIALFKMDWDLSNEHYFYIQNAIDHASAGDTIDIAAGSYVEQLVVTTENLTLSGAGRGVDPDLGTIIVSPDNLTYFYTTGSNNNYPVVGMDGVISCVIENLTVDGDHKGNANYRFNGIAFWNAGGSISNVDVLNIMDNPFSGSQHGVAVYSYNNTGGPYTIVLNDVLIDEFQKNAVALLGSGLTVDIDDVTCIGQGPTDVTAQNGIQVGYGASGTVDNCTVTGVDWTGGIWTATGLLILFAGNIDAYGVALDQCQTSVFYQDAGGTFDNGTITNPTGDGFYAYNSSSALSNVPRALPQPYDDYIGDDSPLTIFEVELTNSILTGQGTQYSWGVGAYSTSADAINLTVEGCLISNWDYGIYAYDYGGPVNTTIFDNSITSCTYAVGSTMLNTQNASGNWYGSVDPAAVGALFEGAVDYTPWLGGGSETSSGFEGDFSELWIDDGSPQSGSQGYFEEAMGLISGSTIHISSGTYNESMVFGSDFSLNGLNVIGDATELPVFTGGVRFLQTAAINGIGFGNLHIKGVAAGGNMVFDMDNSGAVSGFTMDNCIIDGEDVSGRTGFGGQNLTGAFSISGTEFLDILGWAVMDIESGSGDGGSNLPFTALTFAGNHVHHCNGSISLRGNASDLTDAVYVYNNTFNDIGGNNAEQGEQWAAIEVNHADAASIYDNTIERVALGLWGEGQGMQLWDIGTLDLHDNDLTDCYQGIFVFGGESGGTYGGPYDIPGGSIYHNTFSGCVDYCLAVDANCTGTTLDAEENYWGTINCTAITAGINGDVDFEPYCNSTLTTCDIFCALSNVWVDDDWTGTPDGTDLGGGKFYNYNAFDNIPDALDAIADFGEVYVYDGTYYISGATISKPINLTGETQAGVLIAPEAQDVWGLLYSTGGINIKNFTVDGDANSMLPAGRHFLAGFAPATGANANDISVDSVTVRNVSTYGICLGNSSAPFASGLNITNCTVENSDAHGIQVRRGTTQILHNTVNNATYGITNYYDHAEIHDNTVNATSYVAILTFTNVSDPINEWASMNATDNIVTDAYFGIVIVGDAVINDNDVTASYIGIWSASNLWSTGLTNGITMQGNTVNITDDWGVGFNMCNISNGDLLGGPDPGDGNAVYLPTGSLVSEFDGKPVGSVSFPNSMATPPMLAPGENEVITINSHDPEGVTLEKGDDGIGVYIWWCRSGNSLTVQNNLIECEGSNAGLWLYHNDATAAPVITENIIRCTNSAMNDTGTGVGIFIFDDGDFAGEYGGGGDSYGLISDNLISGFVDGIFAYKSAVYNVGVTATGNVISENNKGLYCNNQGNQFYGNYFICNVANAVDAGSSNSWDNGSALGNFWDDFEDNAGYPSTYNVPGPAGSVDNFPWSLVPSITWVDDDWEGTACGDSVNGYLFGYNAFDRIQNGIRAVAGGGTVNVAEGTYREQVKIKRKSLELIGAGAGSSIIEAVDLVDRATYSITQWTGDARTIDACLGVVDAFNVDISGFTVNGRKLGPNNFYGIHYFDTDGSVSNCNIEDVTDSVNTSYSRVVSFVATHGQTGSVHITLSSVNVTGFQKGGIVLMGPSCDCILTGNTVQGSLNSSLAPNGIQVSYGCSGTLTDNSVSGVIYPGGDWAGTCLLLMETDDVSIAGGTISGCEIGIGHSQWNWIYTPTTTPSIVIDGVDMDDNYWAVSTHLGDENASLNLDVLNCDINNSLYSGVDIWGSDQDPWGGYYYNGWINGTLDVNIHDNLITDCNDAVVEYVELASGNSVSCSAVRNNYSGYTEYGVYNNFSNMVDATQCFWGSVNGPLDIVSGNSNNQKRLINCPIAPGEGFEPAYADRQRGTGGENLILEGVSGEIDYSPWWGDDYVWDDHSSSWSWYMDNSNESSIVEAIGYALTGDSINVLPGTYSGPNNRNISLAGKELVIKATETAHNTIIDCELAGRAFHFDNGETEATVISGFTLKNGTSNFNGGAILCEYGSSPTIQSCVIIGNIVNGYGGGIACDGLSNARLVNNTISKNTANGPYNSGGGIYCYDASPVIKNSIVYENYGAGQNQIYSYSTIELEPAVLYCDIQGGWIGASNIDVVPMFRNTSINDPDFHLMSIMCGDSVESQCIDAGHPNILDAALDCAHGMGTSRSDMGAYGGVIYRPGLEYLPGDANMFTGIWPPELIGSDVTYLVNYFRAVTEACNINDFYCSADANGDCQVIGSDVTKMVNYFRGDTEINFCPMHSPMWFGPEDLPTVAPSGWPNCGTPTVSGKADRGDSNRE